MLLWGILGLAALVIDLGLARVQLRQMQSATDTAALEGLRGNSDDARKFAGHVFDTDLDESNNAPQSDVVPEIEIVPVPGLPVAGGTIQDPRGKRWIPQLAGYDDTVAPDNGDLDQVGDTFFARLERSENSTNRKLTNPGAPLPWLFGRLGAISREDGVAFVNRGISLKSVSQANNGRVMTVGAELNSVGLDGIEWRVPIASWQTATSNAPYLAVDTIEPVINEAFTIGSRIELDQSSMVTPPDSMLVAIYTTIDGTDYVAGFGFLSNEVPQDNYVVNQNVTTQISTSLLENDFPELLLQDHFMLNGYLQTPKLAPTPIEEL